LLFLLLFAANYQPARIDLTESWAADGRRKKNSQPVAVPALFFAVHVSQQALL
jgi:hypothetical protein